MEHTLAKDGLCPAVLGTGVAMLIKVKCSPPRQTTVLAMKPNQRSVEVGWRECKPLIRKHFKDDHECRERRCWHRESPPCDLALTWKVSNMSTASKDTFVRSEDQRQNPAPLEGLGPPCVTLDFASGTSSSGQSLEDQDEGKCLRPTSTRIDSRFIKSVKDCLQRWRINAELPHVSLPS